MAEKPQDTYNRAPQPAGLPAPQPQVGWNPQHEAAAWGAPAPKPVAAGGDKGRTSPLKKGLIAAGIAVVLAAGAGAGVYAATGSSGDGNTAQGIAGEDGRFGGPLGEDAGGSVDGQMDGPMGRGGMGGPGELGMGAASLHGEYVVQRDNEYVTMATQTGTVSSAEDGKVTVKSADGYEQTYALADGTQVSDWGAGRGQDPSQQGTSGSSNLAAGQTVRVTALKDGSTLTATMVQIADTGTGTTDGGGTGGGTGATGTSGSAGATGSTVTTS
jgi:hypothetical protein